MRGTSFPIAYPKLCSQNLLILWELGFIYLFIYSFIHSAVNLPLYGNVALLLPNNAAFVGRGFENQLHF